MWQVNGQFYLLCKIINIYPMINQNLKSSDKLIYIKASNSTTNFISIIQFLAHCVHIRVLQRDRTNKKHTFIYKMTYVCLFIRVDCGV